MDNFSRGAEWRRWDLHVHTPFTKLSDGYKGESIEGKWDAYIDLLEQSDVQAFGVTDYFSCDNYFALIERFRKKHPQST